MITASRPDIVFLLALPILLLAPALAAEPKPDPELCAEYLRDLKAYRRMAELIGCQMPADEGEVATSQADEFPPVATPAANAQSIPPVEHNEFPPVVSGDQPDAAAEKFPPVVDDATSAASAGAAPPVVEDEGAQAPTPNFPPVADTKELTDTDKKTDAAKAGESSSSERHSSERHRRHAREDDDDEDGHDDHPLREKVRRAARHFGGSLLRSLSDR